MADPSADPGYIALWSAALSILGTLVAVTFGFGLNELSYKLRTRREDRRTIGRALTELLEIRHHLKLIPTVMEILRAKIPVPIPPQTDLALRNILGVLTPNLEGLQKRYDDSVSSVAGAFPSLAYQLRAKDAIAPILRKVRGMLPADAPFVEFWLRVEDELWRASMPILEELVLEMAKIHGRKTLREVRSVLKKPFEIPKEFDDLLTQLFSKLEKMPAPNSSTEDQGQKANSPAGVNPGSK